MLTGYIDENIHAAIVAGLRRAAMDVVTARERGQTQTDDEILLATATSEGRLMLTNDQDFLRIHAAWMQAGQSHAGIVYWHQGMGIGESILRILAYASQTAEADAANMVKYL